jgi:hypothetical protein
LWWLVGELDGSLEQTNWNTLDWIRGKEHSELLVRALNSIGVKAFLKLLEEIRHQLNVLKHDPVTVLVAKLKIVVCNNILTITKGNSVQHLGGVDSNLSAQILDIDNWVGTRREDEVDWSGWGRVEIR